MAKKQLTILSFTARSHPNDKCGTNGLPLTPNSIRVFGRFQYLKCLNHRNLCRYVDIQRGSHDRLNLISESYSLKLTDLMADNYMYNFITIDSNRVYKWIFEILNAFKYLHEKDITIKCFHIKNLLITSDLELKLINYGLFYITECGTCVDFPIGYPLYTAPECFLIEYTFSNKHTEPQNFQYWKMNNPKIDIWSLGIFLFQFIYGVKSELFEKVNVKEIVNDMIDLIRKSKIETGLDAYSYFIQFFKIDFKKQELIETRWKSVISLIKLCLKVNVKERATAEQLMSYLTDEVRVEVTKSPENYENDQFKNRIFNSLLRSSLISIDKQNKKDKQINLFTKDYYHLWMRGIDQVYYLWRLTGADCMQILRQNNQFLFQSPSITKISKLFTVANSVEHGQEINYENAFDDTLIPVSLDQLKDRLNSIKDELSLSVTEIQANRGLKNESKIQSIQKQPLNIRETDIEYQSHRIALFSRYLYAYPFKKNELYQECRIDIPPHYRALAWAALLDVNDSIEDVYSNINKEIITATDRQIEVDIPRCHQYDALIASPDAHNKLKRILKAWVLSNSNLVYWQGLDSLCAPFLYLNFNNEAVAYGSLQNFVLKYATNFFLKDNSNVIHEYLAAFSRITAFHDPELASHFESIDFRPDLYAIPWFLTMFAHVFPLHKIFHLWDTLLLGNPEFPLCIGVAILKQLRNILLNSDFNECILLFSELPEINIQKCVTDSLNIFQNTPSTCLYLHYLNAYSEENIEMGTVDLLESKMEPCPRIGLNNLLSIKESNALIIDIRNNNSNNSLEDKLSKRKNVFKFDVNINNLKLKVSAKSSDKLNLQQNENEANLLSLLNQNVYCVKAIVSNQNKLENGVELANILIKLGYSKICVLHNFEDI
jgi:TBC domain-containing protein kinase-like protein